MARLPWWASWEVIPPAGLQALADYKYSGTDLSLLVELFLRKFWNMLIEFFPKTMAPNLITALGFVALVVLYLSGLAFCPGGVECEATMPRWVFLLGAAALFFYQVMDNLDGKQARRTGSSSALGELFDHGCDSLFLSLISIPLSNALALSAWDATVMFAWGSCMFYSAHWEEYHSGHLILAQLANPTEGQIIIMILFLVAYAFGPVAAFGAFRVPLLGLTGTRIVFYLNNLGCFISWLDSAQKLRKWQLQHDAPTTLLVQRFAPMAIHLAGVLLWASSSAPGTLLGRWVVPFWLLHGLGASFLTVDIMVQRITKQGFPNLRSLAFSLLPGVGWLGSVVLPGHDGLFLVALLGLASVTYTYYWLSIVQQLARHLKINVFTLGPRPKDD